MIAPTQPPEPTFPLQRSNAWSARGVSIPVNSQLSGVELPVRVDLSGRADRAQGGISGSQARSPFIAPSFASLFRFCALDWSLASGSENQPRTNKVTWLPSLSCPRFRDALNSGDSSGQPETQSTILTRLGGHDDMSETRCFEKVTGKVVERWQISREGIRCRMEWGRVGSRQRGQTMTLDNEA